MSATMFCSAALGLYLTTEYLLKLPIPGIDPTKRKLAQVFTRTTANVLDKKDKTLYLPRITKLKKSKYGYTIDLTLPAGMSVNDIYNIEKEIAYSLGAGEIEIYQNGATITLTAYKNKLPDYIPFKQPNTMPGIIPLYLGESVRGPEVVDLVEMPHMLIGGETKGGKSVLLNLIINALSHNPQVKIHCIDFAGVELGYLQQYGIPLIDSHAGAIKKINELQALWRERKKLFLKVGARNIEEYNQHNKMEYHVLIVDELSIFRAKPGMDKDTKKALEYAMGNLCDLASLGRKYGIHLILCTQVPNADVVPGLLKNNIPCSIAFPIKTVQGSISILGHGEARHLPRIKGRCIYQRDGERQLQVAHLQQPEQHIGYIKQPQKALIYDVSDPETMG